MFQIGITISRPNFTGSCKMAWVYAKALISAGHQVTVLHGPEEMAESEDNKKSFIAALNRDGIKTIVIPQLAQLPGAAVINSTAKHAQEHKLDCLIGTQQRDQSVAIKAASKLKIPGLISFQNKHKFHGRWPMPAIKEWATSYFINKHLRLGICASPAVQDEVVNRFGVSADKTTVVYNGVEVDDFPQSSVEENQRIRQEFGIQPDELMLMNLGRIDSQKGLTFLVEALGLVAQKTRNIKLIQVGDVVEGSNKAESQKYHQTLLDDIKRLGIEDIFHFAGWREDCPAILNAADIYVHSSMWEGWSLAVVEAMGAKLPTIQTDCCGIPEHFEQGKHGYIVPKANPEALAEKMLSLISATEDQRKQIGEAGHRFAVEHFNIKKNCLKFVQLVENVLKEHK